jgi:predicted RNA-binding Zn-ribbon protein involved in translation (DUF1610 family)
MICTTCGTRLVTEFIDAVCPICGRRWMAPNPSTKELWDQYRVDAQRACLESMLEHQAQVNTTTTARPGVKRHIVFGGNSLIDGINPPPKAVWYGVKGSGDSGVLAAIRQAMARRERGKRLRAMLNIDRPSVT